MTEQTPTKFVKLFEHFLSCLHYNFRASLHYELIRNVELSPNRSSATVRDAILYRPQSTAFAPRNVSSSLALKVGIINVLRGKARKYTQSSVIQKTPLPDSFCCLSRELFSTLPISPLLLPQVWIHLWRLHTLTPSNPVKKKKSFISLVFYSAYAGRTVAGEVDLGR